MQKTRQLPGDYGLKLPRGHPWHSNGLPYPRWIVTRPFSIIKVSIAIDKMNNLKNKGVALKSGLKKLKCGDNLILKNLSYYFFHNPQFKFNL